MEIEIPFSFEESGSRAKPTILFLHGFLGNKDDWKYTISQLEDQFHCVAIDLPGHGQTIFPNTQFFFGIPECAKAVLAFMERLEIQVYNLVGYSMGGRLALYLGLNYPSSVRSLILESSSPGIEEEHERLKRQTKDKKLSKQLISQSWEIFLRNWYSQPLFMSLLKHPDLLMGLIENRRKNNQLELARSLTQMGPGVQPSLWSLLKRGKVPLKLIVGEDDLKFLGIAKRIVNRYPLSCIAAKKDCGHNIHLEAPDVFVDELISFFGGDHFPTRHRVWE